VSEPRNALSVVIVGGGQAAAVAARALRRKGHTGSVVIVGEEPVRPYQRPPLSKEYLAEGDASALDLLPESWTADNDVEVRTGVRALKISAADAGVLLDDGTTLPADRVLLATGGRPRRLPDAHGDRVRYLRTRADADALDALLTPGGRLVVVGGGFIGAEVASTALARGVQVTVLEAGPAPMARALGHDLGTLCGRLQRDAGVDLRVDAAVRGVRQEGEEVVVETSTGTLAADCVLVGIGMVPNDEVARDSGIETGNGVLVDEHCRTSLPHVYAAGDVANHHHPLFGTRMRVEHFDNASRQASVAVDNMLGRATIFDDPHWFWSDQHGANLQFVGHAEGCDRVVTRGDTATDSWSAFFLRDGRVRAAFGLNQAEDVALARELISLGLEVPAEVLADPDTDLMEAFE